MEGEEKTARERKKSVTRREKGDENKRAGEVL